MSWHVDPDLLRAYTEGPVVGPLQLSIEAHLTACADCRGTLATFVDKTRLDRTWSTIRSATLAPKKPLVERALAGSGIPDHTARLLAATPSLRRSWLLAVAAVFALAVGVAHGATDGYLFFLAVAPLLPLAGIAAAFGPGIDPTYEIGIAAPMRSFGLLLIRAAAVLTSTVVLGSVAAAFLPQTWAALAWLLPSVALVTTSLALSTVLDPLRAAATVAVTWLAVVGSLMWSSSGPTIRSSFGVSLQIAMIVMTFAAGLSLVARHEHLEKGDRR